jgi:uncharacterized membrane protein
MKKTFFFAAVIFFLFSVFVFFFGIVRPRFFSVVTVPAVNVISRNVVQRIVPAVGDVVNVNVNVNVVDNVAI